jgi:molecular chaperone DnaK
LKELAESTISEEVTEAVITVPAYFNDSQRADTKKAAEIAGLRVLGLVNEPTAGALQYAFEQEGEERKTVLVFDFGGGTLDLSLVELEGDRLSVQAVSGDTHLGGRDFDEVLMRLCLERFDPTGGTTVATIEKEECHLLRDACEKAKMDLSRSKQTTVSIRSFHANRVLKVKITRDDFNSRCAHLLARIRPPLEEVLEFGGLTAGEVDEIITISGSSMIPAVHDMVARFFGKRPFHGVSPLEAVAKSAAIMAGKIKGRTGVPNIQDLEFRDICPLSIGVDIAGEQMSVVIPAGTRLPATKRQTFGTVIHGQDGGRFQVFEGPWLMTKRNRLLGSFEIEGIPPAEAGREQVELTFSLDSDRILTVKAHVVSQGTTTTRLTVRKTGCLLGTKEIQRIKTQSQAEKDADAREFEEAGRRSWLELLAENLEKFFASEPHHAIHGQLFAKLVPAYKRQELRAFVRSKLPGPDEEAPSWDEMADIVDRLLLPLGCYLNCRKGGIPDWLEQPDAEKYTPSLYFA